MMPTDVLPVEANNWGSRADALHGKPRAMKLPTVPIPGTLSEAGMAGAFTATLGARLRYDHRRGHWLRWHKHRWALDRDGMLVRLALDFVKVIQYQALELRDERKKTKVVAWAIGFERRAKLEAMLGLAKNLAPIADAGETWDTNPTLLGVPNGVVDLTTGTRRAGQPEDRITLQAGVPFDPLLPCPRWQAFMDEVLPDSDVRDFVRRGLGYSLTGHTGEQCLFFGHGGGSNGKGSLLNTVAFVLGEYAYDLPFTALELAQRSAIPNDLAALDRKRFVTASETNDGTRLNEARIKSLTGCDPVTARFLHGEFFTFRPMAKLWLVANHRPVVRDDSFGFWRRMRLIPFTERFALDPELESVLREEGPGILAWLVWACLDWQEQGLEAPAIVRDATAEYQQDSDVLSRFLEEACELVTDAEVGATDLYRHYQAWAGRAGLTERERLTATKFGTKLVERFRRIYTRSGWVYVGLARRP